MEPPQLADRRRQALALRRQGEPVPAIAAACGVSKQAVYSWLRAADRHGEAALSPRRRGRRKAEVAASVRAILSIPTLSLKQAQRRLQAEAGRVVSLAWLSRIRRRLSCKAISAKTRLSLYAWTAELRLPLPQWDLERWIQAEEAGDPTYPDADDRYIGFVRKHVSDLKKLLDYGYWLDLPDRYQEHVAGHDGVPRTGRRTDDFDGAAPLPEPTRLKPGSPAYGKLLRERAQAGQALRHPQDARIGAHEHLTLAEAGDYPGRYGRVPTWKSRNLTTFASWRRRMADRLTNRTETDTPAGRMLWADVPAEQLQDLRDTLGGRAAASVSHEAAGERIVLLTWDAYQRLVSASARAAA